MRKFIVFFILIAVTLSSKAQGSYNYAKYGVGIFASSLLPFDDLKQANKTLGFSITGYYNLTPYIPLGAEFQFGELSGGSIITDDNKRQYDNKYKAFIIHGDLGLGEVIDYTDNAFKAFFKDFYFGTGIGLINNNMAFIQRTNLIAQPLYPVGTYTFPGQDNSINLIVPLRIGYEYKIYNSYDEPIMSINIGYVHNITWGEGLDGYTDPQGHFKNNQPDQYRQIIIGLKFNFGSSTAYDKSIN